MKIREMINKHFDFIILTAISVLFIPFFGLNLTIDPILTPQFLVWCILTLILLLSLIVQIFKKQQIAHVMMKISVFPWFLGYFLFSLLSLFKAVNVAEGVYEILKIFVSIAYLFLASVIFSKNKNYFTTFAKIAAISAIGLSSIGLYQYFIYAYHEPGINVLYSITGTMAHKNLLASGLLLLLPFSIYLLLIYRGLWKISGSVSAILVLLNIFLLQSRSVWLAFLISSIAAVALILIYAEKLSLSKIVFIRGSSPIVFVLAASFLIFVGLYSKSNDLSSILRRAKSTLAPDYHTNAKESPKEQFQNYSSNVERVLMWKKSLKAVKDNLLLGHGAGNWKLTLPSYGLDDLSERSFKYVHFQRPHNDYIWVLYEIGIFGFIFYMAVFAVILFYIYRIISRSSDSNDKFMSVLMFFGIIGYMVDAFFSFPKERIFHSIFLLLMIAFVVSIYCRTFEKISHLSRKFILTSAVLSIFVVSLAIADGWLRLNAEIHTKKAYAARLNQDWRGVISQIDKAYSPYASLDPMSTPLYWYKGEAHYWLKDIPQALDDYKQAYKAHPYHIHVLNNLATCYEIQLDHENAIKYYKKALEIYPHFEETLINLGAAYFNSSRYQDAYLTLSLCDPNTLNPKLKEYLKIVKNRLDN